MARPRKVAKGVGTTLGDEKGRGYGDAAQNQDVVRRLLWDIASINIHLDEIRDFWAKALGISSPQWMILMALADLDRGQGVPVKDVSTMLHVDPSFVTTQSKILEKNGFMRRIASKDDARVVLMSLSDKASKQISNLSVRQELLNQFIFAEFDACALKDVTDQLASLRKRLEKATLKLSADI
jgi:MarR family transcriptional regulator, organic hydroperoxide resistance regulator